MEKSEIETIYRKYFHDVFLYIRALSENESLAEEITQETFLKAMNNIEKFDGRKDIRAWLFVIAKNTYFRIILQIIHMKKFFQLIFGNIKCCFDHTFIRTALDTFPVGSLAQYQRQSP